jgi:hypothetical protein
MTDDIAKCIRTIRVLTSALRFVRNNDASLTATQRQLVDSALIIAEEVIRETADAA